MASQLRVERRQGSGAQRQIGKPSMGATFGSKRCGRKGSSLASVRPKIQILHLYDGRTIEAEMGGKEVVMQTG